MIINLGPRNSGKEQDISLRMKELLGWLERQLDSNITLVRADQSTQVETTGVVLASERDVGSTERPDQMSPGIVIVLNRARDDEVTFGDLWTRPSCGNQIVFMPREEIPRTEGVAMQLAHHLVPRNQRWAPQEDWLRQAKGRNVADPRDVIEEVLKGLPETLITEAIKAACRISDWSYFAAAQAITFAAHAHNDDPLCRLTAEHRAGNLLQALAKLPAEVRAWNDDDLLPVRTAAVRGLDVRHQCQVMPVYRTDATETE